MMGYFNGVTRGQFSSRSLHFLLAALCLGLGILGVHYWNLCWQFNDLGNQLKKSLQKTESVEYLKSILQNQLHLREDELSQVKEKLINSENLVKAKMDELNSINNKFNSLKESNDKCNEELGKSENKIEDMKIKLNDIEQERDQLSQLNDNQKNELNNVEHENENLRKELEEIKQRLITNNDGKANNNSIKKSSLIPSVNAVQASNIKNNDINSNDANSAANNVANNATNNVANNVANNATNNVANNVANNATNNVANNVVKNATNNVANNVVKNATNNVANNVANNVNNNVLQKPMQLNKDLQKSQVEAPESAANNEKVGNGGNADNADNEPQPLKQPIIAEPNKIGQQLPSIVGLEKEDRKGALVNVNLKNDQNEYEEEPHDSKLYYRDR